jgi:hypothetical protein
MTTAWALFGGFSAKAAYSDILGGKIIETRMTVGAQPL